MTHFWHTVIQQNQLIVDAYLFSKTHSITI